MAALAASSGAELGIAVGGPSPTPAIEAGSLRSGSAWSTIKVPIALAVLADADGPDGLTAAARDSIGTAITRSDNEAAAALFDRLSRAHGGTVGAAGAVTDVLREAGDSSTMVSTRGRDGFSPYGQTEWSLAEQARLASALAGGCLVDPASSRFVAELMGRVSAEPWGLGALNGPATVRWKGGWGPATDGRYLVRQFGILDYGRSIAVVALAARAADGTFEAATRAASDLASLIEPAARKLAAAVGACDR